MRAFRDLLFFLLIITKTHSQNSKLFYYISNDSLLGVKNETGQTIIHPKKQSLLGPSLTLGENFTEIKNNVIFFYPDKGKSEAYNREGKYLFEPNFFDFSIEEFQEGFLRIVNTNKMGLADKFGKIIINPKYDFISRVNFGIIQYCNGCYWDYKKDEEHPKLVGGKWGYLDKYGIEIQLTKEKNHPKDLKTKEGLFIPYQFKYDKIEKEILDFFEKRKEHILKANNFFNPNKEIYFEIIEKPNEFEPYYLIRTYQVYNDYPSGSGYDDDFQNFKVSPDLKKFYVTYVELINHGKYSEYVEKKILVDDWLKNIEK